MKKLLSVSNILAAASCLLALVGLIVYIVNVNSAGYFQGATIKFLIFYIILVMVLDLLIVGASFLKLDGILAKVLDIVLMVVKVAVPLFLMIAGMTIVLARAEGLAFIYGANEDVILEVQTPENLASSSTAIANAVILILGSVVGIVGAFFLPKEREALPEQPVAE